MLPKLRLFTTLAAHLREFLARRPAPASGQLPLFAIEQVEARLLDYPQVKMPLRHLFAPGLYYREIFMPRGTFVIGHEHRTRHFNIVLTGRARVLIDGRVREIAAPDVFISEPHVRKVLYIVEDMRWATLHPTGETDLERLEDLLIVKSKSYLRHSLRAQELAQLKDSPLCPLQP